MTLRAVHLDHLIRPADVRRANKELFPILSMTMHDGLVDQTNKFKKRVASVDTSQYKVVKQGQLVVGFPIDEGVLSFQNLYDEAIVSPAYDIWDLRDEKQVDRRYLARFLRSSRALSFYAAKLRGTTARRRTLPDDIFLSLPVPLPPVAEQRRIAEVFERASKLRSKRQFALAQLTVLARTIFFDLFGDPISNPRNWRQETLETFFLFKTGKLDSNAAIPTGQFPFFTCSKEDLRIDSFSFDCEALLLSGNNANADYSVKHYRGKFNAYQRTYVIILRNEHNSYEYARFALEERLAEMKRISKGTNTKYLTMELLNKICVPVPPELLQREFARRVDAVEKLKAIYRASLTELDALFESLQHRAFRGEL